MTAIQQQDIDQGQHMAQQGWSKKDLQRFIKNLSIPTDTASRFRQGYNGEKQVNAC